MKTVTIRPETQREKQVVHQLGSSGWKVLAELRHTACFDNQAGIFVEKNGHKRWVRKEQVQHD